MKKPIEEKTPLAAWATTARDEAGMSVEEVVDALAERGHVVRAATIRGIEGGSKGAGARLRKLLAEVYGKPGPLRDRAPEPDPLLSAISALVEEIRADRQARVAWERGLLEALRELAGVAEPSGDPEPELPAGVQR